MMAVPVAAARQGGQEKMEPRVSNLLAPRHGKGSAQPGPDPQLDAGVGLGGIRIRPLVQAEIVAGHGLSFRRQLSDLGSRLTFPNNHKSAPQMKRART
jgi:hypothetical protein